MDGDKNNMFESVFLLGSEHGNPQGVSIEELGDRMAIGTTAVVDRNADQHHFANNEDACGAFRADHIGMCGIEVADAHWGSVAAEAAVQQFPAIIAQERVTRARADFRDVYFRSALQLSETLKEVGQRSRITYPPKEGCSRTMQDSSTTQLWSVVEVMRRRILRSPRAVYYAVGLGDCAMAVIERNEDGSATSVRHIRSGNENYGDLGSISTLRSIIRREVSETYIPRWEDPMMQNYVNVVPLNVHEGSVVILGTDGFSLRQNETLLLRAFDRKTVREGIQELMNHIASHRELYHDNISLAAMETR